MIHEPRPAHPADSAAVGALRSGHAESAGSRYVALDLMRGLAAIAVLLFHIGYMLGPLSSAMDKGYLAVDFFFVLSGFVIAANYHATVRPSLSWLEFLSARIARLWPLFALTTLLGSIVVTMKLGRDAGYFDAAGILSTLALNSAMLPSFFAVYGIDRLFIFNGASWSVFFELAINLVFFATLRGLSLKRLLGLAAVFGGVLLVVAQAHGSLDGGWSVATFHVGTARILFGFTAGMATYLISRRMRFRANGLLAASAALGMCLALYAKGDWRVECALVIAGFPLLVLLASRSQLTGVAGVIGRCLGDISYSVYLLQTPAMLLAAGAMQFLIERRIAEFAPISGLVFVVTLLGISYLNWRHFEVPARRCLQQWLLARRERRAFQS